MRQLYSLRYYAVCLMLEYLFFQEMTLLVLGLFESVSEAKCEYEDANLIWPNTGAYLFNDVKAMAWYKGKDSLIATWLEGKGFKEYDPYIGRLMQIGETGIKLKTVNRSDRGSYWLSLTLASTDHKLEAVTHFEVIVAPSSKCKPTITDEGSILKAELPSSEGCGIPPLSPKWKTTSKTVMQKSQNQSLLDLGNNFEFGEYVVCAEGDSAICYHGNISDFCTGYIKSQHRRHDDGLTPNHVSIIIPIVLVAVIAIIVSILAVIWWKRKFSCGNKESEEMNMPMESTPAGTADGSVKEEGDPLIEKGFPEIKNYLRGLYKDMTSVSLSPTGKENFVDVSEVYINLDFQQMETRDSKYTETDQTSYKASVSKEDFHILKAHVSPIIIVGSKGCGKSTWCKHVVQCWSQNSKTENANIHGINLPYLGEYQVLLYLPLKSSDRGLSFQELLQQTLFQGQPKYLNIIMKYMHDKNHAQSILILIDGFDIISVYAKPMSELFDHKLFSLCTVIFTCRPSSFKLIFNACVDSSIQLELYKICEIPLEKSTAYASKVLSRLSPQYKDINIKNFLIFTRNLHVQSLLKVPYLCLTLLCVWMENKNPYIEITDILLRIMEHLLGTAKTDRRCKEKLTKLSQGNSLEVHTSLKKLDERFAKIKYLIYEFSMTTEEMFLSKTEGLTVEERLGGGTRARGKEKLSIEVLNEIGLVTESVQLKSMENQSTMTFINVIIYQFFLSMAIAFKKGHAFNYIVSDMDVAVKHSMIIHMLWQFSPALGKEILVDVSKLKNKKHEKRLSELTNKCRYSITKQSKKNKNHQMMWLQLLMYKGTLNNEKLLFLTNALRSKDSLTSLVLENTENNDELVFWLPCSQTLEKLTLNINNCTLLLCPEWHKQIPVKLKEVAIKSVIISSCDLEVLCRVFISLNIKKQAISPKAISTGDFAILS
ncbi:hypothetical protein CHS0354_038774 [Potamilus streckersoni]|uniref:NACHT domain-containing protein n=1 Tax=Potamilus streckersoni TaxID=2493646 RepID=A0AAE0VZT3_9BIVA|nr:hypothetical protein CHS0354_038774 [Potamilus streckersoni]